MSQIIDDIIASSTLPSDPAVLLAFLLDSDGSFVSQEGQTWDFKETWPFSYSDGYFGGICRLICGFANARGGLIVFGVHDKTRTASKNSVIPNVDKLLQSFQQLTGRQLDIVVKRYDDATVGKFDILLVPPILPADLPIRFLTPVDRYGANIIWIRQGHEVVVAEPRHIPTLYCRSMKAVVADDVGEEIDGQLPPSPATIKKFVGRMSTIDQIFRWLKVSDEPRTFLFGKGGSGKSTIAYEVVRTIKNEGAGFLLEGRYPLEKVMYLSAKQKALNTITLEQESFVGLDFTTEKELYEGILTLADAPGLIQEGMTVEQLKKSVVAFLDQTSCFLVVDDIDTLTTKGLEAGFDFLFGALWRAKKRSKLLYTLRNVPTQSLANSIEVPGLAAGGEYEEFVDLCADQFKVPMPDPKFVAHVLAPVSERRPLVVESIVALRRHCGTYEQAISLFETRSGDDARRYVFEREWDALPTTNRGREILAILNEYKKPLAFGDLCTLAQLDESKAKDAIAAVQEMFLQVDHSGTETTYRLGALTKSFVDLSARSLDLFQTIRTRVEKYKSAYYAKNPKLTRIISQVDDRLSAATRYGDRQAMDEAWRTIEQGYEPAISEDPRFHALRGRVAVLQLPPKLNEARESFERAFRMRYAPEVAYLRDWFYAEQNSDMADVKTASILDFVRSAKGYTEEVRAEFISRRAAVLYRLARSEIYVQPARSLERLRESLRLHTQALRLTAEQAGTSRARSEERLRNTAYYLVQQLATAGKPEDMIDFIADLSSIENIAIDPLEEPIAQLLKYILQQRRLKADMQKAINKISAFSKVLKLERLWLDKETLARVTENCDIAIKELEQRIKTSQGKSFISPTSPRRPTNA